ncbi:MAG: hypothetical protein NT062_25710 [Proteobacteria bacterium]|nr:hypothetical protein [Pseudomonadota bacterium]
MTHLAPVSVRQHTPWFGLAGIVFIVLLTIGNAVATMIPCHLPTAHELQQAEQRELIDARRARIEVLLAQGDHCRPVIAHELARALVYDGRPATAYADDYERRCGSDPVMRGWAEAPLPRSRR